MPPIFWMKDDPAWGRDVTLQLLVLGLSSPVSYSLPLALFLSYESFTREDWLFPNWCVYFRPVKTASCWEKTEDFQGHGRYSIPWSSSSGQVVIPFLDSDLLLCSFMAGSTRELYWQAETSMWGPKQRMSGAPKKQRYFHTYLSLESVYNRKPGLLWMTNGAKSAFWPVFPLWSAGRR